MQDDPVLDLDELLDNVGGDRQLADMLLQRMGEDVPQRLAALRSALDAGDAQRAHEVGHALKGALASIRAKEAREAARALDDAVREGDIAAARSGFQELETATQRLQAAIEARCSGSEKDTR